MGISRLFHTSPFFLTAGKSALGLLRKKTGYGLANCRKALELNDNDPVKAEEWLKEQAKALGWNAAMKVQTRKAVQGLVGIAADKKKVAMVEVNCETDFVSKNSKFRSLVELVATACLDHPILRPGEDTNKVHLSSEELGKLKANDSFLADHLAMLIGSVGEKMILRRAFCFETTREDVVTAVAVHPPTDNSKIILGKYGAFICFEKNLEHSNSMPEISEICENLCKHIIGMKPTKIGEHEKDKPAKNPDEEKVLIHQDFLLDSSITVGQLLMDSNIKLLDFERFECGDVENEENPEKENEEEKVHAVTA